MTVSDEDLELDPMSLLFVQEYIIDRNGAAAAERAGFQGKNPSWWAWKRLRDPRVAAMVDQMTQDRLAAAGVRVDRVMEELARLAFANIGDFIDDQGRIDVTQVPREMLAVLESYSVAETDGGEKGGASRTVRIKMSPKLGALEKIQKYLGIATDKVQVDHLNSDGSLSPTQRMTDEELRAEAMKRGLPVDIFADDEPEEE